MAEIKKIVFRGHEVVYKIEEDEYLGDRLCTVSVAGGPRRVRAVTTCKKSQVKRQLKLLINTVCPPALGELSREKRLKMIRRHRPR